MIKHKHVNAIIKEDYVLINEAILKEPVFNDPDLFKTWSWIILNLEPKSKKGTFRKGYSTIHYSLKPGEMLLRYQAAASKLSISIDTLKKQIKKLKRIGCIQTINKNTHTIIKQMEVSE